MQPPTLERTSTNETSEDNPERMELLWTERQEALFRKWQNLCLDRGEEHALSATKNKWRYRVLGLLMVVVPATLGGVTQVYSPPWLLALGFTASSFLSGVQTLFNFGGAYIAHNEYSAKYEDFKREMVTELIKPKAFRQPCDVYLRSCEMTLNAFTRSAPDL